MGASVASVGGTLPPSASSAAPDALNLAMLRAQLDAQQKMMQTLVDATLAANPAGKGANVNAYA